MSESVSSSNNNQFVMSRESKSDKESKHLVKKVRVCTDMSLDVIKDGLSGLGSMLTVWSAKTRLSSERDYKKMLVAQYDEEQKFLEEVKKNKYIQENESPEEFLVRIQKELLGE